jgi:excinuclease ABC subunit B
MTDSMKRSMKETERRREHQEGHNTEHGIQPMTILRDIHNPLIQMSNLDYHDSSLNRLSEVAEDSDQPLNVRIDKLEKEMRAAARSLEFEQAAVLRDRLRELKELQILAG